MQISGNSNAYDGGQAQRLLAMALSQDVDPARQDVPGESQEGRGDAASPPPGPPPSGASDKFAADTLSSLISAQESGSGDLAAKLIGAADSNGDGLLSLAEIQSTLGGGGSDATGLTAALGAIDKDGDGKLSADELTAALDTAKAKHAHHGHHGHRAHDADAASDASKPDDTDSPSATEAA